MYLVKQKVIACPGMRAGILILRVNYMNVFIKDFIYTLSFLILTSADTDGGIQAGSAIYDIYIFIRNISPAIAAVGIAGSAFDLLKDSSSAEKAKKRIIVILMAVAAVWLIPPLLTAGKNLFAAGAWDPSNPI